jgi:PAS domain S-box-containing protein
VDREPETKAWPADRSEIGARIRAFDWTATPLGPIEDWPQSLRTIVDLMLGSRLPMVLAWGRDGTAIYNDPFGRLIGPRNATALGRSISETLADVRRVFEPHLADAWSGRTVQLSDQFHPFVRTDVPEDAWFDITYNPVRDERGEIAGVLCILTETTARVLAERARDAVQAALRESDKRQSFLLDLSDRLRALADPHEIMEAACEALARHLDIAAAQYSLIGADQETAEVAAAYSDDRVARVARSYRYRLSDHGPGWGEALRSGAEIFSEDNETDPRRSLRAARGVDVRAGAAIPLVKGGRLVACLSTGSPEPRPWSEGDRRVHREVAERTWVAVERAHAKAALRETEERLRRVLDVDTVGVVFFDFVGGITGANDAFLRTIGFTREELEAGRVRYEDLTPPEWQWRDRQTLAELKATGESAPFEKEYFRKDRSRIWIYCASKRLTDGTAVEFVLDVTDRKRAEAALRESEERFRAVANLVPDLLWRNDLRTGADWYNRRWLEYTGRSMEEASGEGWLDVIHPDDRAASRARFRHAVETGEPLRLEHRIRRTADGMYRWFLVRAEPVRDEDGVIVQWFGAATDIHEQRTAMDALRESERRQRVLTAELQHRVNNALAMVRAIASQTLANSETVDAFHESFEGRLNALARAQHLLVSRDVEEASLSELIEHELMEYGGRLGETVTVDGPDVRLRPTAVQTLAMAFHELTVNAVKHGALSPDAPTGRIAVAWAVEPAGTTPEAAPRLLVRWAESGVPHVEPNATRRGQGRDLIEEALPHVLKGTEVQFEFRRGGVRCTFDVPLRPDVVGYVRSMTLVRDDDADGEG